MVREIVFWSTKGDQFNKALKPALRFFIEVLKPWGATVQEWTLKKKSSREIYQIMEKLKAGIELDKEYADYDRQMFKDMVDVFEKIAILLNENEVYYGKKIEEALDLISEIHKSPS